MVSLAERDRKRVFECVSHVTLVVALRSKGIVSLGIEMCLLSCIILLIAARIFTLPPLKIINTSKALNFSYMR